MPRATPKLTAEEIERAVESFRRLDPACDVDGVRASLLERNDVDVLGSGVLTPR